MFFSVFFFFQSLLCTFPSHSYPPLSSRSDPAEVESRRWGHPMNGGLRRQEADRRSGGGKVADVTSKDCKLGRPASPPRALLWWRSLVCACPFVRILVLSSLLILPMNLSWGYIRIYSIGYSTLVRYLYLHI